MRRLALLLAVLVAAPARAEPPSEAEWRRWLRTSPQREQAYAFDRYLRRHGVAGILATGQILRTATDWRACGVPFEVPPTSHWPRIVPTLRFIRDEIRPRIGAVEAVSGYRSPALNACANGAPRSAHVGFWGLDLVPATSIGQPELFRRLCALHRQRGRATGFGLGFYGGTRFHVDTKGFRLWGANNRRGTSPCV